MIRQASGDTLLKNVIVSRSPVYRSFAIATEITSQCWLIAGNDTVELLNMVDY